MATMARSKVIRQRVISSVTHEKPPEIHHLKTWRRKKNLMLHITYSTSLNPNASEQQNYGQKPCCLDIGKIVGLHGFHVNFSRSHGFTTVHVGGMTSMLNSRFTNVSLKLAVHTEPDETNMAVTPTQFFRHHEANFGVAKRQGDNFQGRNPPLHAGHLF